MISNEQKQRDKEYKEPAKDFRGVRVCGPKYKMINGKKKYWIEEGNYVRILWNGQIVRKDKAQPFIDKVLDKVFLEEI
jgi:hypothetical protein